MSHAVHVLEVIVKPGNTGKLQKAMQQEVTQLLDRQPGFKGVITLADQDEPRSVLILSFWTKMDGAKKVSSKLCGLIRPLPKGEAVFISFRCM